MAACENTHKIKDPETSTRHTALFGGQFIPFSDDVMCIVNFAADAGGLVVHVRVCVRAMERAVCDAVVMCVEEGKVAK